MKEFLVFPRRLTAAAVLAGLASVAALPSAVAFEINFDEADGTVIDDEYAPFLTVSAKNNSGSGPDLAVAYDPSPPVGHDPDLEQPFTDPKAYRWDEISSTSAGDFGASTDLYTTLSVTDQGELQNPGDHGRKILIVQENDTGCGDGVCDDPDDEGGGHNFLIFDFDQAVTLASIDIFDLDAGQNEDARIAFFYEGHSALGATPDDAWAITNLDNKVEDDAGLGSYFHIDGSAVGADSAARFFFGDGVENVRRMVVAFSSSGAVTGLVGTTSVPEPGTLALLGVALAGMARVQRSRRSA